MQDFKNPEIFAVFKKQENSLKRKLDSNNDPLVEKKLKTEDIINPMSQLEQEKVQKDTNVIEIEDNNQEIEELEDYQKESSNKNLKNYVVENFQIETTFEDCGCLHETVAPINFPRKSKKIKIKS